MDIAALAAELRDDPAGLRYAAALEARDLDALTALLTTPHDTTRVPRGTVRWRQLAYDLSAERLEIALCGNSAALQAVGVPATIADALTSVDKAVLDGCIEVMQPLDAIPVDGPLFGQFLALLQARGILRDRTYGEGTLTVAQQIALVTTRAASRAEELWGSNPSRQAVADAWEALHG